MCVAGKVVGASCVFRVSISHHVQMLHWRQTCCKLGKRIKNSSWLCWLNDTELYGVGARHVFEGFDEICSVRLRYEHELKCHMSAILRYVMSTQECWV